MTVECEPFRKDSTIDVVILKQVRHLINNLPLQLTSTIRTLSCWVALSWPFILGRLVFLDSVAAGGERDFGGGDSFGAVAVEVISRDS